MVLDTTDRSDAPDRPAAGPSDGFISYSREESAALAVALQVALERFAKPWYRLRAVRVFRDDASMSANSDLRGTIEAALERSGWFILLASPKAALSPWVASEVQWWLDHRAAERILLIRATGNIEWDAKRNRFDPERCTAVPALLHDAYRAEPRWIDLTWFEEPGSLGKRDPRFVERVADLAAPLHGRDRADLVGENVHQHRRAVRLARAAVAALAVLLVLALVAAVLAVQQKQTADQQRDEAVRQNVISAARQLAATAVNLTDSDMQRASLLAVHAYRLHADAQTAGALWETAAASPHLVGFLDAGSTVTATAGTPDGRFVIAGTEAGDVLRWDRATGRRTTIGTLDGPVVRVLVSEDASVVAASTSPGTFADPSDVDAEVWREGTSTPGTHEVLALSPAGDVWVEDVPTPGSDGSELRVVGADGGTLVLRIEDFSDHHLAVMPTSDRLVVASADGTTGAYELPSGRQLLAGHVNTGAHAGVDHLDPTGSFVIVGNGSKDVEINPVAEAAPGAFEVEPAGYGKTGTPVPTGYALSAGAQQVATSVDGRIWVGTVSSEAATAPSPLVLPGSGTTRIGTLAFVGQRLLLSGSGTAVSVWDLEQASRLGPLLHVRYASMCNGCGPGEVLMNPAGDRAVAYNEDHSSVVFTDFSAGTSSWYLHGEGDLWPLASRYGGWLDDERFLTWDDTNAVVTVWTGDGLAQVDGRWTEPALARPDDEDPPGQVVPRVRPDGRVVLVDDLGGVRTVDVAAGRVETSGLTMPFPADVHAIGLDDDGRRVWALTPDDPFDATSTRLQVVETETGRVVLDEQLDGEYTEADLDDETVTVSNYDRTAIAIDLRSGDRTTVPVVLLTGSEWAHDQPFVVTERNGLVSIYDTDFGAAVGTFEVPTEAYAWTQFGFSDGDKVLGVASTASDDTGKQSVRAIRLGYDAWLDIDCATAGRDLTADEWRTTTNLAVPDDLSCAGP